MSEQEQETKTLKKQNRRLRTWLVILLIAGILGGWTLGSFVPFPFTTRLKQSMGGGSTAEEKFSTVLDIMTNQWFFADTIEDEETRLVDQALTGMTTNEEDPHTAYMSKEEIDAFNQSINRNFVGIGVTFTTSPEGTFIVTSVFPGGPAEEAGVQVGDIIHAVDGEVVDGLDSTELKDLVQGEEGTDVTIDFLRDGKTVTLTITRAEVSQTATWKILDNDGEQVGYLHLMQFGNSSAEEVANALADFQDAGVSKLIIDLRSDGGGYLEALKGVLSLFLPEGTVFLQEEDSDGNVTKMTTTGGMVEGLGPIVILVNENTASAAEAFTLAMDEGRDDVTVAGTKTYGKGTVQVTTYFSDGSALHYTNAKWMSPSGVWVNNEGITPEVEVELPEVLNETFTDMEDTESYSLDSVSDKTALAQKMLAFLGYEVDRTDGYFDPSTEEALNSFAQDLELTADGILDKEKYDALFSEVIYLFSTDLSKDTQMVKALEILHG